MRTCTAWIWTSRTIASLVALIILSGCSSEYEKLTEGTVPRFCYATLVDAECYTQPLASREDGRFLGVYLHPETAGPTNREWLELAREHFAEQEPSDF